MLVVVAIVVYGVGCAVCGVRRPLWRSDFDHFQTSKQAEMSENEKTIQILEDSTELQKE